MKEEMKKLRNVFVSLYRETSGPFEGRWRTVRCRPVQGRRKIGTFDFPGGSWTKKEATELAKQLLGKKGFPNPMAVRFGRGRGWTVGWGDVELLKKLSIMSHEELGKAFGIPAQEIRAHAIRLMKDKEGRKN